MASAYKAQQGFRTSQNRNVHVYRIFIQPIWSFPCYKGTSDRITSENPPSSPISRRRRAILFNRSVCIQWTSMNCALLEFYRCKHHETPHVTHVQYTTIYLRWSLSVWICKHVESVAAQLVTSISAFTPNKKTPGYPGPGHSFFHQGKEAMSLPLWATCSRPSSLHVSQPENHMKPWWAIIIQQVEWRVRYIGEFSRSAPVRLSVRWGYWTELLGCWERSTAVLPPVVCLP